MSKPPDDEKLGSLAQSARMTNLNTAMGILIFVGVVLIGFHTYEFITLRDQAEAEMRKQGLVVVDHQLFEQALMIGRVIVGAAIGLGVLFIILGLLVKKYPVPCTITGLVLYVLYVVGTAILNPENIRHGLIIKIFIIVGLAKAVQAAIAYQSEVNRERTLEYER